jgi:hypothetical protein
MNILIFSVNVDNTTGKVIEWIYHLKPEAKITRKNVLQQKLK